MAGIARAARVSRQALYLNFADRAELLLAVVRYVDEKRDLSGELKKIADVPTAVEAVRAAVALQARMNPGVWAIARALDAVRRTDDAAEKGWQDRLKSRLEGCRQIAGRLAREGMLRKGWSVASAADVLWSVTSLRTWEDLVLQQRWTAAEYEERICRLLIDTLVQP